MYTMSMDNNTWYMSFLKLHFATQSIHQDILLNIVDCLKNMIMCKLDITNLSSLNILKDTINKYIQLNNNSMGITKHIDPCIMQIQQSIMCIYFHIEDNYLGRVCKYLWIHQQYISNYILHLLCNLYTHQIIHNFHHRIIHLYLWIHLHKQG